MRGYRMMVASALFLVAAADAGCSSEAPKPPPPAAPAPPPPPPAPAPTAQAGDGGAPAKPKMVAPTDGLSLAERMAKKKAEDEKLAAELAAQEKERLLKYDKGKLAQHKALFTIEQKLRKQYDDAEAKARGKPDAKAQIEKVQAAAVKTIEAQDKVLRGIDPQGGNSNIITDHDVVLNALKTDYPAAIIASFDGDEAPLKEQRAELDKRTQKITGWLDELKTFKGK